jgi:suppressor for copper-sensitivity B
MLSARRNLIPRCRASLSAAVLTIAALTLFAVPSFGASSEWFEHEQGAVRLISANAGAGSGQTIALGLEFRMKPGWKVYWRSPGDAGFPPEISWIGSTNFAGATMSWPAPTRFSVLGLETLGYKEAVVFPIRAEVFERGKTVDLAARVRFLTCDDICVPYETILTLSLPAGRDLNTPESGTIAAWQARVPTGATLPDPSAPLAIERVELAGSGDAQALVVRITGKQALKAPDLFVEGPVDYGFKKPIVQIASVGNEALMQIGVQAPRRADAKLAGETVTLTLVDGDRSVERKVTLERASATALAFPATASVSASGGGGDGLGGDTTGYEFLAIIGLALLGGLILNLMPCVLPVLSIKLISVVSHGGEAPGRIRAGFLASSAGIIACFLLLGTVAVGLQSAGLAAGWGIQFQQPAFLAFMIAIITLFACNMWGLFEIRLPGAVADAAANTGQGGGLRGNFLTGAFATLLATPCTAPFLGTAVGFALSRGPLEIYSVFLALGIGLAAPWIVVAAFPVLATRLPKPGQWMITLKRVLSIALIGTALWLLSVLWFQIGSAATGIIATLMVAMAFSVWQYRHLGDKARFATWIVVGLLTVISMVGASSFNGEGPERSIADGESGTTWRTFDLAVLRAEVAQGNTVFVDVTADWCLTCQVNKSLVLNRGRVAEILGDGRIVAMKADWTRPDAVISDYLKSFGRYGIPFNVVYGPAAPQGVPLPEILTESSVLAGFEKAGGKAVLAGR